MKKTVDVLVVSSPIRASPIRTLRSFTQPILAVNYEPLQAAASIEEAGFDVAFLPLFNIFPYYTPSEHEEKAKELLREYEPRTVLFLSSLYLPGISNPAHPLDIKFAELLKNTNPEVRIILGGSHASYLPCESLQESQAIDSVALFECEEVLGPLVKSYLKDKDPEDVQGIVYRSDDGRIVTKNYRVNTVENLDSLPVPAYHLLKEWQTALTGPAPRMQLLLMTSRGCPYQCAFCASVRYTNNVRCRSGSHVGAELSRVKELFGNKAYFYAIKDNNFTFSPKHVRNVGEQFREYDMKTDLFLTNVTSMNEEIAKLTSAFCWFVFYGVETSAQPVLRNVTKWHTLDHVVDACYTAKKAGLMTTLNFIVGLPQDTHESLATNLATMAKLRISGLADNVSPGILVPYPGTDIFENPERYGITIYHYNWEDYEEVGSYPTYRTKNLSRTQIFSYFLMAQSMDIFQQKRGLLRDEFVPWLKKYLKDSVPGGLSDSFLDLMSRVDGSEEPPPMQFPFERTPAHVMNTLPPAVSGVSAFSAGTGKGGNRPA